MDKRIIKTKKSLKEALLALLKEKDFENIRTTEICERALVSRNTFYNYYTDKYALLEDCFRDFEEAFQTEFDARQQKSNGEFDIKKNFLNLIDTFFDMESRYHPIQILSNFDMMALYYRAIMNILREYEDRYARFMNPEYDLEQLNSFLVLGFWGFMHENRHMNQAEVQERTHKLMLDLLHSPIFRKS